MYYIGIDPGSIYTGLAILQDDIFVFHREYDDPVQLYLDLVDYEIFNYPCRAALEDMLGTGRRDSNIVRTIKVVGYFEHRLREAGVTVELVAQQARLAYVSLVPKNITGKDEIAAAAHALASRERHRNVLRHIEGVFVLGRTSPQRTSDRPPVLSSART